jgi:S-formylglutathione hydrolase FrmB
MRPWTRAYAGRFETHELQSEALQGNALGDSPVRPLWVYLPPAYDEEPDRSWPTIYVLQGFSATLASWNVPSSAFRPTYQELVDETFASGAAPPCVVVWVDAWTALGGSQFVDSPATGRYHTYLCEDVVRFVDDRYRTLRQAAHRGVQGKSSGGFGAAITAMLRPDLFGGFASHAGDSLYEYSYLPELAAAYRVLRDHYDRSFDAFWEDFRSRPPMAKPTDWSPMLVYAMSACFSADDDGTIHFPFDLATGAVVDEVWQRWLDWDPVRMVPRYADALRSLKAIWIDAGRADQFHLDIGAEALAHQIREVGVTDLHFELFEGTHSAIEYRYPLSLAYLAGRLSVA